MSKEIISAENAPKAVGPYSHAVKVGNMMFLSGQIPLDPKSGEIVGKTIKEQTNQCFNNINAVLEAGSFNFGDIVSCDVYLTDISEFNEMNEVYKKRFEPFCKDMGYPSRAAVQVTALPKGVKIQIKVTVVGKS